MTLLVPISVLATVRRRGLVGAVNYVTALITVPSLDTMAVSLGVGKCRDIAKGEDGDQDASETHGDWKSARKEDNELRGSLNRERGGVQRRYLGAWEGCYGPLCL